MTATGSDPDLDPLVGTLLADRYRIFSLLGEGGMGRVYLGEHALMRKRVAVKILHRELTQVAEVVMRFEREAMAAANIDHPNVAAATDFGKLPDGSVFLVLEYVQGKSLRELIDEGPLRLERALHVAQQMTSALVTAHALGIVHRDLKPENVMLVEKGGDPDFVKVLDFGIAKVPVQEVSERGSIRPAKVITRVGMIFGTPEYMAPEQALGQYVDARADLYALGIVLYEMLSGRRPFSAESPVGILGQQLQGPLPTFAQRAPHVRVPHALEQLILRLLAPTVAARFPSAVELIAALNDIQSLLISRAAESGARDRMHSGQLGRSLSGLLAEVPPSSLDLTLQDSADYVAAASLEEALNASTMPAPTYDVPQVTQPDARRRDRRDRRSLLRLPHYPGKQAFFVWGLAGTFLSVLVVGTWLSWRPVKPQPLPVSKASAAASEAAHTLPLAVIDLASEEQLKQARKLGQKALEQLTQRFPKDGRLWVELAKASFAATNVGASIDAIRNAVLVDPGANKNAELATILWKTAQKRETSPAAIALLEGGFGERGIDILYDLTTTAGVRSEVRLAASSALYSMAAQNAASPSLKVLLALEHAKTCQDKLAILPSVAQDGDARSLPFLSAMHATVGCGKRKRSDCFECLRHGLQLENAIAAVKQREAK